MGRSFLEVIRRRTTHHQIPITLVISPRSPFKIMFSRKNAAINISLLSGERSPRPSIFDSPMMTDEDNPLDGASSFLRWPRKRTRPQGMGSDQAASADLPFVGSFKETDWKQKRRRMIADSKPNRVIIYGSG